LATATPVSVEVIVLVTDVRRGRVVRIEIDVGDDEAVTDDEQAVRAPSLLAHLIDRGRERLRVDALRFRRGRPPALAGKVHGGERRRLRSSVHDDARGERRGDQEK
jgi:hypothetical protein